MKLPLRFLRAAAVCGLLLAAVSPRAFSTLDPGPAAPLIAQMVSRILEQNHYNHHPLDDKTSRELLKNYLEMYDYNHMFFVQADVARLEAQYGGVLDQKLKEGDASPAYAIFDRFLQRLLFRPLGMRSTRYRPPRSWLSRIAPTEVDTTYRHRLVRGDVHDENAHAMGGISGHAGLFSTAEDLVRFAQMMLRGGTFPSSRARSRTLVLGARGPEARGAASENDPDIGFLQAATIAAFTHRQDSAFSSRALGWDTPDGQNSAGSRMGAGAFGHTGFTGTSIWMDPARDLFVVLLTNRVHPTRENTQIFEVRRWVADFAVDATSR